MIEILASIDAPRTERRHGFCCGIVLQNDKVVVAADIVRYMRGWTRAQVRSYCAKKGWRVSIVSKTTR